MSITSCAKLEEVIDFNLNRSLLLPYFQEAYYEGKYEFMNEILECEEGPNDITRMLMEESLIIPDSEGYIDFEGDIVFAEEVDELIRVYLEEGYRIAEIWKYLESLSISMEK